MLLRLLTSFNIRTFLGGVCNTPPRGDTYCKERKISKMNRKELFGASVVGALSLSLVGSFSCFPVFADVKNPVNISIVEMVDDGAGGYKNWEDITGAMPGMTYSAIPRILNSGEAAVGVRMCLEESGVNATGDGILLPDGSFTIDINDDFWKKETGIDNNGTINSPISVCYKYNTDLAVGAMTEPLFYEVSLNSELGNEYQDSTFGLHLLADAIGDGLPSNPDTGVSTNSEPLTVVWYVSLSAGLVILVGMIIYLLSKKAQKR